MGSGAGLSDKCTGQSQFIHNWLLLYPFWLIPLLVPSQSPSLTHSFINFLESHSLPSGIPSPHVPRFPLLITSKVQVDLDSQLSKAGHGVF